MNAVAALSVWSRRVLRTNGEEQHLPNIAQIEDMRKLLNAGLLEFMNGPNRMTYCMHDQEFAKKRRLPINHGATFLINGQCKPGIEMQILGDVVIFPEGDLP